MTERTPLPHKPRRGEVVEITAERLEPQRGRGCASWEVTIGPGGQPRTLDVKIDGALPGEHVRASVRKTHRSSVEASAIEIVTPHPARIEPRCPHHGRTGSYPGCGGCTLQSLPMEAQLDLVRDVVRGALAKHGVEAEVHPVVPPVSEWYYRNKMELSFGFDRRKEGARLELGLHPRGYRHEVFGLEHCYLQSPESVTLSHRVVEWARSAGLGVYDGRNNAGELRTLTIREGKRTGERMAILTTSHLADESLARDFADAVSGSGVDVSSTVWIEQRSVRGERTRLSVETLAGRETLREELHLPDDKRLTFEVHPLAFFQPNTLQAERLYGTVIGLAEHALGRVASDSPALDLYCGTGTIGLCLASYLPRVIGVELQPNAVDNARENADRNGLSERARFIAGDVGEVLGGELEGLVKSRGVGLVVVDPPRAGLNNLAMSHLQILLPSDLIYVSCNPMALGRDLARLVKEGYEITAVQPVAMFPQTAHIETVVALRRHSPC